MKFIKKQKPTELFQWYKNGDHPDDASILVMDVQGSRSMSEGNVVRYFRHPSYNGLTPCIHCSHVFHDHGHIENGAGGLMVCPGDWVYRLPTGEYRVISDKMLNAEYERYIE